MDKLKNIILNNVKPNNDAYSWDEVNCFYKPFAIAFGAINESFFDDTLLLVSFYYTFCIESENCMTLRKDDILFEIYDSEIQDLFGVSLKFENYGGERSFHKKVIDCLKKNKIIIVPADLFFLPYSINYKELHNRHYIIIKGVDVSKKIYYILDNMHINGGADAKYCDFAMDFKMMYSMVSGFNKNFDEINTKGYFWNISDDYFKDYKNRIINHAEKVVEKIIKDGNVKLCLEEQIVSEIAMNNFTRNLISYLHIVNFRGVFFELCYKKMLIIEKDIVRLKRLEKGLEKINELNTQIKMIVLRKYSLKDNNVENLINKMDLYRKWCQEMFDEIHNSFKNSDILNDSENNLHRNYVIKNNNDAKLEIGSSYCNMFLFNNITYNLWNNYEDACIVMKKITTRNIVLSFSNYINVSNEEAKVQSGIYIKMTNGKIILAGLCGMMNYEIHEPALGRNYLKYKRFIGNNKIYTELNIKGRECILTINRKNSDSFKFLCSHNIEYIGLFAKTWEKHKYDVRFENITFLDET